MVKTLLVHMQKASTFNQVINAKVPSMNAEISLVARIPFPHCESATVDLVNRSPGESLRWPVSLHRADEVLVKPFNVTRISSVQLVFFSYFPSLVIFLPLVSIGISR